MFNKKMIAAAAALLLAQTAFAAGDQLIDSVSADFATTAKARMVRLDAQKYWDAAWFQSNGTHLSGYWEGSVGFWRQKQYMNVAGADKNLWDVGFTPVFRFENDSRKGMYYE